MPNYEFQCGACGKSFELRESLKEHDRHREKCPQCGSDKISQRFGTIYVKTSKKS
jgi:putative FmdB family regulatory protein